MTLLARLRRTAASLLGRTVLVWLTLALGAAAAAPAMQPAALQDVCSSATASATGDWSGSPAPHSHLDCPLCLPVVPPPPVWAEQPAAPHGLNHLLRPAGAAHAALHDVDVPPARGPPLL